MRACDAHWCDRAADVIAEGVVLRVGVAGKRENLLVGLDSVP